MAESEHLWSSHASLSGRSCLVPALRRGTTWEEPTGPRMQSDVASHLSHGRYDALAEPCRPGMAPAARIATGSLTDDSQVAQMDPLSRDTAWRLAHAHTAGSASRTPRQRRRSGGPTLLTTSTSKHIFSTLLRLYIQQRGYLVSGIRRQRRRAQHLVRIVWYGLEWLLFLHLTSRGFGAASCMDPWRHGEGTTTE